MSELDPLAVKLGLLALRREKARRQIERGHADLPRSERVRIQNTRDLWCSIDALVLVNEYLATAHPIVTRGTTRLLSRVINALYDVSIGAEPALFDVDPQALWHPEGGKPTGSTMGAAAEGGAAVAAELLLSAMSKNDAVEWLTREVRLVDRGGNPVRAQRIVECRKNFRRGRGAALGRRMFEMGTEVHRALINAPKSELKTRRVEEAARALVDSLATSAGGDIHQPPQRRT